jgi:hypothetical protein
MSHELHVYEYVCRPFGEVRAALVDDAVRYFEPATEHAAERARNILNSLSVTVAGLEVGKRITIHVRSIQPRVEAPAHMADEALRIDLEWEAETRPGLFPSMNATLLVYALSPTETQLDLRGTYVPPGGALGAAADRAIGHRVAQASVHRFLETIVQRLGSDA